MNKLFRKRKYAYLRMTTRVYL